MNLRILWGSPLPPTRSGVSDYAVELLAELCTRARVRVLSPPGVEPPADGFIEALGAELVPADTQLEPGELQLLHLGNNPYHTWILDRLGRPSTVVVLHDLVLHHLLVEATLARGDRSAFEEVMVAVHGEAGAALSMARRHGMSGRLDPFLFPATALLAGTTDAVVVHSEWARQEVEARLPGLKVCRVGLPAADPGVIDRASIRHGLGLALETLVLMHLGFLTAEKGLLEILEAVAAAARLQVPVHLIAVGEGEGLQPLIDAAASLGIADKVSATGWAPKAEFLRLPAAADLGIVLRTPSAGETSAAAVRFLACGTPVAAIGQRQFLEWPEAAVPRICPGPSSAPDLARLLVSAAEQSTTGQWENRRRAARAAYESQHRPAETAEALVSFFADLPLRT